MCREDGSQGLLAPTRVGLPRMLTNVGLARPSLRHPPGCLEPSWWTAVGDPQDEPGGRRTEIALQPIWSDRRALPTVAAGDESPMNPHERRVQRAFSRGLVAPVCSARNPMSEPAREGSNHRKKGEHFSANRPPTHSGE
jgi:hypothetical protein